MYFCVEVKSGIEFDEINSWLKNTEFKTSAWLLEDFLHIVFGLEMKMMPSPSYLHTASLATCKTCNKTIDLVDRLEFPLYYFGAGPNNPQDAEVYFCGPKCAREYQKNSDNSN